MSFVATGVGAGSLAALGTSGLIAATPALAAAGTAGAAGAAGAGLGAAGGGLLSSAVPVATTPALTSVAPAVAPAVTPWGTSGIAAFSPQAASQAALSNVVTPAANALGNGTSALGNSTAFLGGTPSNMMSGMTSATPGMFDGLGGALSTGLEKLNDVAQPAANISQAVSPFMSEEQPIQASPIAPPTYSNNLNELVAQNEQTDQQRMQDEMMRRMEQRQRIQAMGEMA